MYKWILLVSCILLASVSAIDNGIGRLPPMGWRSWNCFGGDIDQTKMTNIMDALVDRSRIVGGKPTSLADLGYIHVGLDDNWQLCNAGINGSFHTAQGNPIINKQRFPDMKQMTQYAHSKNLKPGWYMNNCICNENGKLTPNWPPQMHGDVNAIFELGYDGVKIDGCGPSHDLVEWADLLNKTGRPIMIENCHDNTAYPYWNNPKTFDFVVCPMNFWRVSNDIGPNWASIISNLQQTIRFQDLEHPISQPGCWAYPDMLEVGNGDLTYNESRSHFGAWCVVSAPLVLGLNLLDSARVTQVWDIITNVEALEISQSWNGHPGRLVSQSTELFTMKDYNGKVTLLPSWQVWAKSLAKSGQGVFLVNIADSTQPVSVKISDLGFSENIRVNVRDIWEHKDLGVLSTSSTYSVTLAAHDSKFLRFQPV